MNGIWTNLWRRLAGQGERRKLSPGAARLVRWVALGTAAYNLWAVFAYPEALLHRGIDFGLFFALVFLLYTSPGTTSGRIPWYDWLLAGSSPAVSAYIWLNLERFLTRYCYADPLYPADIFFGCLTILLLLEGSRRIIGPWLSAMGLAAVAYALWGSHIPGLFGHGGFTLQHLIELSFMTTDGIWSSVLGMAATYIVIFILFGSFLQHSGAAGFLFDFASAVAGRSRGGLAKIGVIASGLFGMISGSPAANVTSVGAITIPMMKKSGYPADFAAAVETCASTGGIIMPPVMGSVAFIMAEVTGLPYIKIAAAAFFPAVLFYLALFFTVDYRAGKLEMRGMRPEEIPPLGRTLLKGLLFLIPLFFLIYRLMAGISPSRAGLETILLILAVSWLRKETRMGPAKIGRALTDGIIQSIMVFSTMAASGIMLGVINLTGLGTKFSVLLLTVFGQARLGALLLTMGLALFLGLAMNITPSYLLTAVIAGPFLIQQGITPMAAHLFILFFAAMAPLTPPVAPTAFAAAGIAGAPPMRVGFLAMRIALVAYVMPFIFIYQPALLLQGSIPAVLLALLAGILAVALLAMGTEGWSGRNLGPISRFLLVGAGLLTLTGYPLLVSAAIVIAAGGLGLARVAPRRWADETASALERPVDSGKENQRGGARPPA